MNPFINFLQNPEGIMGIVAIISSLLCCFVGYKSLRVLIVCFGLFVGVLIGAQLCLMFAISGWLPYVIYLVLGLLIGALCYKAFLFGTFLLAAGLPFLIITLHFSFLASSLWIIVGLSFIFGLLAVKFVRSFIIVVTALYGGLSCGPMVLSFLQLTNNNLGLLLGLILALIGIMVQFGTTKKTTT